VRPVHRHAVALAAVVALVSGACGGGDSDSRGTDGAQGSAPSASSEGAAAVAIKNFEYSPSDLKVAAGSEVSVVNEDSAPHTLTADDGSFDTGNLSEGQKASVKPSKAGRVSYHCTIHDYMKGTLEVT